MGLRLRMSKAECASMRALRFLMCSPFSGLPHFVLWERGRSEATEYSEILCWLLNSEQASGRTRRKSLDEKKSQDLLKFRAKWNKSNLTEANLTPTPTACPYSMNLGIFHKSWDFSSQLSSCLACSVITINWGNFGTFSTLDACSWFHDKSLSGQNFIYHFSGKTSR